MTKIFTGYRLCEIAPSLAEGLKVTINDEPTSIAELLQNTDKISVKDKISIGGIDYRACEDDYLYLTRYYKAPDEFDLAEKTALANGFVSRLKKHLQDGVIYKMTSAQKDSMKKKAADAREWLQTNRNADMISTIEAKHNLRVAEAVLYGNQVKELEDLLEQAMALTRNLAALHQEESHTTTYYPANTTEEHEIHHNTQTREYFQKIREPMKAELASIHSKMYEAAGEAMEYTEFVNLREQGIHDLHAIVSASDTKRFFDEAASELPKPSTNGAMAARSFEGRAMKAAGAMRCIDNICEYAKTELTRAFPIAQTPTDTRDYMLRKLDEMRIMVKARTGTRGSNGDEYHATQPAYMFARDVFIEHLNRTTIDSGTKIYVSNLVWLTSLVTEYRMHLDDSLNKLVAKRHSDLLMGKPQHPNP